MGTILIIIVAVVVFGICLGGEDNKPFDGDNMDL